YFIALIIVIPPVMPATFVHSTHVSRASGVTILEGISSQDLTFTSEGSFKVKAGKTKGACESVESALTIVPEFPVGS
ncbi:MAG TPA: hypothetical protein VGQ03_00660, partial [Nitrososphaera sp.]|nr:hypothetical protein [Nitrososphaera sp.]